MPNCTYLEIFFTAVIFFIVLYFLIIQPRKKLLAKLQQPDLVLQKIHAARTSTEFIAAYIQITENKPYYVFLFHDWCYAVAKQAKEKIDTFKNATDVPHELNVDFDTQLKAIYDLVVEVYEPLPKIEKVVYNQIMKKEIGFELVDAKGVFF